MFLRVTQSFLYNIANCAALIICLAQNSLLLLQGLKDTVNDAQQTI